MISSSRLRPVAASLSLLAVVLLTALPAEHLHPADSALQGPVIHRHLSDAALAQPDAPADRDDHATADHGDHATADHDDHAAVGHDDHATVGRDDHVTGQHDDQATFGHDDHATARPLSPVFQTTPRFVPAPPVLGTASVVLAPDSRVIACVAACDVIPVHSPPLRLLPSRAPPTHT